MAIDKVTGTAWADLSKISDVAKADIAKVAGQDAPSGAVGSVITNNLMYHWDFNDSNFYSSGSSFTDLSNSNTGTLGGSLAVSGTSPKYISMDGVNDYAQVAGPGTFPVNFTVEIWIQRFTNQEVWIMNRGYFTDCTTTNAGYWMKVNTSGDVQYTGRTSAFGSFTYTLTSGGPITPNAWKCITWVTVPAASGNISVTAYINGVSAGSSTIFGGTPDLCSTTSKLTVGNVVTSDGSLNSSGYRSYNLSEARVYDAALTSTEVLANYNARKARYGL